MAAKYGLTVVSVDFIHDSVEQGRLLNTDNYILVGKTISEEFNSGKILGKNLNLIDLSCGHTHLPRTQRKSRDLVLRFLHVKDLFRRF